MKNVDIFCTVCVINALYKQVFTMQIYYAVRVKSPLKFVTESQCEKKKPVFMYSATVIVWHNSVCIYGSKEINMQM